MNAASSPVGLGKASLLTGILLTAVLSFETVAFAVVSSLRDLSGISLDAGFWSMGASAAAWFSCSIFCILLLLRSRLFPSLKYREMVLSSAAFLLFFLVQLYRRPFALPFWDDYYGYFEWQLHLDQLHGFLPKSMAYFESYLECKTSVSRAIAGIFRIVSGAGFVHLTKLLNLLLLGTICWLLAAEHSRPERRNFVFLTCGLLLFNLEQFYNLLCAFSGTTYYTAVLAGVLAFHFQRKKNLRGLWMTLLAATIAAYTFGNGWIIFPMVVLYYFTDRNYRSAIIASVAFMIACWWYFHDYHPQRLNPMERFDMQEYILYCLSFLGGHLQFHDFYFLPFIMAGSLLLVFLYALANYSLRIRTFISLSLLTYMVGSAFLAGLFRHQNGFQQSLSLRYGFFSVTALAATVSFFAAILSEKKFHNYRLLMIATAASLTGLKSFFFYPEMAIAQTENHRMIRNWLMVGTPITKRTAFYPEGTTELLEKAEKSGIWEREPGDTAAVNSSMFTIAYISPGSDQQDP